VAIVRKADRKLVAVHSVALTNKPAIVGMEPIVNRADAVVIADSPERLALCEMLELPGDCDPVEVLAAAARRITALSEELEDRRINERIEQAIYSGRIRPADRDWARRLLVSHEGLFDEWLRSTEPVVALGRMTCASTDRTVFGGGGVQARARSEFRAHPELAALTSEEAFVDLAVRDAEAHGPRSAG